MARKKKPIKEHEIIGKLKFKSMDSMGAKFEMEEKGQGGNRNLSFPAAIFPGDFDPTTDTVDGEYMLRFEIKRK